MNEVLTLPILSDNYTYLVLGEGLTISVDPGESRPVTQCLKEQGRTLDAILVTHEERIADAAHRQIRILDGRIVEDTLAPAEKTTVSKEVSESKWCDHCNNYVRFMMSINHSYCIECGGRVRLFNRNDSQAFHDTVQRHKWQAS